MHNILKLVSKFVNSNDYSLSDQDQKAYNKVEVIDRNITFNTNTKKITYKNCDYSSNDKLNLFLHDLLDIYFKTQAMKQKESNCLSPVTTHEIKNILSSAKLSLEMLSTYDFDLEDRKKLAHQAFDAVNQSIAVFEEMLQMERFTHEQARKEIVVEDVGVIHLLNKIVTLLAADLKNKNITLTFDNTQQEITIQGSSFWLERAFYNLLSNAIKYNIKNGTIDIIV
ncbi:MAG: sensor histidine kinase, partial [Nitrososphaeraceae archaeon]